MSLSYGAVFSRKGAGLFASRGGSRHAGPQYYSDYHRRKVRAIIRHNNILNRIVALSCIGTDAATPPAQLTEMAARVLSTHGDARSTAYLAGGSAALSPQPQEERFRKLNSAAHLLNERPQFVATVDEADDIEDINLDKDAASGVSASLKALTEESVRDSNLVADGHALPRRTVLHGDWAGALALLTRPYSRVGLKPFHLIIILKMAMSQYLAEHHRQCLAKEQQVSADATGTRPHNASSALFSTGSFIPEFDTALPSPLAFAPVTTSTVWQSPALLLNHIRNNTLEGAYPYSSLLWQYLMLSYAQLGLISEAVETLEMAVERHSRNVRPRGSRARVNSGPDPGQPFRNSFFLSPTTLYFLGRRLLPAAAALGRPEEAAKLIQLCFAPGQPVPPAGGSEWTAKPNDDGDDEDLSLLLSTVPDGSQERDIGKAGKDFKKLDNDTRDKEGIMAFKTPAELRRESNRRLVPSLFIPSDSKIDDSDSKRPTCSSLDGPPRLVRTTVSERIGWGKTRAGSRNAQESMIQKLDGTPAAAHNVASANHVLTYSIPLMISRMNDPREAATVAKHMLAALARSGDWAGAVNFMLHIYRNDAHDKNNGIRSRERNSLTQLLLHYLPQRDALRHLLISSSWNNGAAHNSGKRAVAASGGEGVMANWEVALAAASALLHRGNAADRSVPSSTLSSSELSVIEARAVINALGEAQHSRANGSSAATGDSRLPTTAAPAPWCTALSLALSCFFAPARSADAGKASREEIYDQDIVDMIFSMTKDVRLTAAPSSALPLLLLDHLSGSTNGVVLPNARFDISAPVAAAVVPALVEEHMASSEGYEKVRDDALSPPSWLRALFILRDVLDEHKFKQRRGQKATSQELELARMVFLLRKYGSTSANSFWCRHAALTWFKHLYPPSSYQAEYRRDMAELGAAEMAESAGAETDKEEPTTEGSATAISAPAANSVVPHSPLDYASLLFINRNSRALEPALLKAEDAEAGLASPLSFTTLRAIKYGTGYYAPNRSCVTNDRDSAQQAILKRVAADAAEIADLSSQRSELNQYMDFSGFNMDKVERLARRFGFSTNDSSPVGAATSINAANHDYRPYARSNNNSRFSAGAGRPAGRLRDPDAPARLEPKGALASYTGYNRRHTHYHYNLNSRTSNIGDQPVHRNLFAMPKIYKQLSDPRRSSWSHAGAAPHFVRRWKKNTAL